MSDSTLTGMMSEEDFLEHYGVKGMKWGKRGGAAKLGPDGNPAKSRKELRGLNKASRKADAAKAKADNDAFNDARDGTIDAARARIKSGENKAALKDAKAQYKVDKAVIGKREAKKSLNAVKDKVFLDQAIASEAKSGKEAAQAAVLAVAGSLLLAYAAKG